MLLQTPLPADYMRLSRASLDERIAVAKASLGERLTILGHHYQRDDVIKFADYTGDSLKLAKLSLERPEAEFVVFCGVHFMAEGAVVLAPPGQQVILPDLTAGCSMADMADPDDVDECWEVLQDVCGDQHVMPLTYVNSAARLKAFVGHSGGCVCTSGNADTIVKWALDSADKLLFFPDQHLGRNTAYKLGVPLDQMLVWNPYSELGGHSAEALRRARVILWQGHCSVHSRMSPEHVRRARETWPGVKVLVHPECPFETVQLSDYAGSTEFIIKQVQNAPAGSSWAIGTEIHLVNRLARQHPEQTIVSLDDCRCQCATMFRISPQHLCWVLEELTDGRAQNVIRVPEEVIRWARVALDRMLERS
ncbi:MAG: quinolinate synthase NadA [Armatimonadetes bacterium]|nr:quinolinate synthase NadA [Armatimonadota bacterium]